MANDGLAKIQYIAYWSSHFGLLKQHWASEPSRIGAEVNVLTKNEDYQTKKSFIDFWLPHAPTHLKEQMLDHHCPFYAKLKAAFDEPWIRPDFSVLQLICVAFWAEGPVATAAQLEAAIVRMFPYFGSLEEDEACTTTPLLSIELPAGLFDDPPTLGSIVDHIVAMNTQCHERLFDTIEQPDRSVKLRLDNAFIAEIFEGYGFRIRMEIFDRFLALPFELRLNVWRKSLRLENITLNVGDRHDAPKHLSLDSHRTYPTREPRLDYWVHGEHGPEKVIVPPLKKLLAGASVGTKTEKLVVGIFYKETLFALRSPDGYSMDLMDTKTSSMVWLGGITEKNRNMMRKADISVDMNRDPVDFVDFVRRTTPYLRKVQVTFYLWQLTHDEVRKIAEDFRQRPAVISLSRLRGVTASVKASFAPGPRDYENERLLFKDHETWLEEIMSRPKEIDNSPTLPSLPDTTATSPKEAHGDVEHAPDK